VAYLEVEERRYRCQDDGDGRGGEPQRCRRRRRPCSVALNCPHRRYILLQPTQIKQEKMSQANFELEVLTRPRTRSAGVTFDRAPSAAEAARTGDLFLRRHRKMGGTRAHLLRRKRMIWHPGSGGPLAGARGSHWEVTARTRRRRRRRSRDRRSPPRPHPGSTFSADARISSPARCLRRTATDHSGDEGDATMRKVGGWCGRGRCRCFLWQRSRRGRRSVCSFVSFCLPSGSSVLGFISGHVARSLGQPVTPHLHQLFFFLIKKERNNKILSAYCSPSNILSHQCPRFVAGDINSEISNDNY
jgi:hypothetical protein